MSEQVPEQATGVDEAVAAEQAQEQPYKDDTSDGTTAARRAEETAGNVKAGDDIAREAAGREHPEEGHDVRDYRPSDTTQAEGPEAGDLPGDVKDDELGEHNRGDLTGEAGEQDPPDHR